MRLKIARTFYKFINSTFNPKISQVIIGQFFIALLSLIYGKVISKNVSTSEYGIYTIEFGLSTFVFSLTISPVINYFKLKFSNDINGGPKTYLNFLFYIIISFFILLFLLYFIIEFYNLSFFILLIFISTIIQGLYTLNNEYLNLNFKQLYSAASLIIYNTILIILIYYTSKYIYIKSNVIWFSMIIAGVISFIFSLILIAKNFKFENGYNILHRINWTRFYAITNYIKPLILLTFFQWIINYFDRYFINQYFPIEDVGVYGMGYNIGSKTLLLASPFISYLFPVLFEKWNKNNNLKELSNLVNNPLRIYLITCIIVCVFIFIFKTQIGELFLSTSYARSFSIIPLISMSSIFVGAIYFYDMKFYVINKIKYILYHTIIGALFNISLNLVLYFFFRSIIAVAFANILSTFIQFLAAKFFFKKLNLLK